MEAAASVASNVATALLCRSYSFISEQCSVIGRETDELHFIPVYRLTIGLHFPKAIAKEQLPQPMSHL